MVHKEVESIIKYNQKRWDATCPITAGAAHMGGGGSIFKPVGEKVKNPWHPSFPWQSPPQLNISRFLSDTANFEEPCLDSKLSNS